MPRHWVLVLALCLGAGCPRPTPRNPPRRRAVLAPLRAHIVWEHQFQGESRLARVLIDRRDGTIYAIAQYYLQRDPHSRRRQFHQIVALRPDGKRRWMRTVDVLRVRPVAHPRGGIVFIEGTRTDKRIVYVDAAGSQRFRLKPTGKQMGYMLTFPPNLLLFATVAPNRKHRLLLFAVDERGKERWHRPIPNLATRCGPDRMVTIRDSRPRVLSFYRPPTGDVSEVFALPAEVSGGFRSCLHATDEEVIVLARGTGGGAVGIHAGKTIWRHGQVSAMRPAVSLPNQAHLVVIMTPERERALAILRPGGELSPRATLPELGFGPGTPSWRLDGNRHGAWVHNRIHAVVLDPTGRFRGSVSDVPKRTAIVPLSADRAIAWDARGHIFMLQLKRQPLAAAAHRIFTSRIGPTPPGIPVLLENCPEPGKRDLVCRDWLLSAFPRYVPVNLRPLALAARLGVRRSEDILDGKFTAKRYAQILTLVIGLHRYSNGPYYDGRHRAAALSLAGDRRLIAALQRNLMAVMRELHRRMLSWLRNPTVPPRRQEEVLQAMFAAIHRSRAQRRAVYAAALAQLSADGEQTDNLIELAKNGRTRKIRDYAHVLAAIVHNLKLHGPVETR